MSRAPRPTHQPEDHRPPRPRGARGPASGWVASESTSGPRRWVLGVGWALGVGAACLLALTGCGGRDAVEAPRIPPELANELTGLPEPRGPRDDYWTETYGDYLRPEELFAYWVLPEDRRLAVFGGRWLEFCLREDLLDEHRWALSREEVSRVSSAPDYDGSVEVLGEVLGAPPR